MQVFTQKSSILNSLKASGIFNPKSLSFRLALTSALMVLSLSLIGAWYFLSQQKQGLSESYQRELQTLVDATAQSVSIGLANDDLSSMMTVSLWLKSYSEVEYILFLDPDGELIAAFPESYSSIHSSEQNQISDDLSVIEGSADIHDGEELFGKIVLARSLNGLHQMIADGRQKAALATALVMFLGALISMWVASAIASPLRHLSLATAGVSRGTYERVDTCSNVEEVSELTKRFNVMVDEIASQTSELIETNEQLVTEMAERAIVQQERQKLEERVQQAKKLESLGILAGGIAHDFNNLLMGVLGNASLMMRQLEEGSSLHTLTDRIQTAGVRLSDLTNQMLAYSGKGKFVNETLSLSAMTKEMLDLLSSTISQKAAIALELDEDIPAVIGDPSQIRQIIMNLITNASDALGDEVGTITLHSGVMHADRLYLLRGVTDGETNPGEYCYIEVSDTGCGIAPDTLKKMFDPFYTTKFTGRGLGLSAVLGIIGGHNGSLQVDSKVGVGTTIRALFPASGQMVASDSDKDPIESIDSPGDGTILIVDDEEIVRDVATITLEGAGFKVLHAHDGVEGVAAYAESGKEISLVLLDMMMPNKNGEETFREIIAFDPDATVVLSSGYDEQDTADRFESGELAAFLKKPYKPADLVRCVKQALGKAECASKA